MLNHFFFDDFFLAAPLEVSFLAFSFVAFALPLSAGLALTGAGLGLAFYPAFIVGLTYV